MSDWKRITKEVSLEELRPEMVVEINKHIKLHNLGPILSDAMMCIQTESERTKNGLFGGAESVYTGAVVTPRWLVWVTSGSKTQMAVLSAQLREVTVQDYAQSQFAKMAPDFGINVSGKFTDVSENGTAFIGVDNSAAGRKFTEVAANAAQEAKK